MELQGPSGKDSWRSPAPAALHSGPGAGCSEVPWETRSSGRTISPTPPGAPGLPDSVDLECEAPGIYVFQMLSEDWDGRPGT